MINFQFTISVADVINFALLIMATTGVWLTFRQLKLNYRTQKATFFKDLYSIMYGDSDIREGLYLVNYDKFAYNKSFHGSQNEKFIDRMLSFLDLICDLYYQDVITDYEMKFFKYELSVVYKNEQIRQYLNFLRQHSKSKGLDTEPFPSFTAYCDRYII